MLKEGTFLIFDDPYNDEGCNDTAEDRVVLLLRVERPLRQPRKAVADGLLWPVTKRLFAQATRKALDHWATRHWPCAQRQSSQLTLGSTAT